MNDEIRQALFTDKTIDIITTGAKSGLSRRIEIWYTRIGSRFYICGTPSNGGEHGPPARRDWLANMKAHPQITFCLKDSVQVELKARAAEITDAEQRRQIMSAPETQWYRAQGYSVDELVAGSPIVEIVFEELEG